MANRRLTPLDKPIDMRLGLPGSKSFANRAIVCAALSRLPCTISNPSPGDDTALMLNVLVDLGWTVKRAAPRAQMLALTPPEKPTAQPVDLYTGPAGTVTRFTAALLTVVSGKFTLDGNDRMRERPMGELIDALRQLDAGITEKGNPGCVPLEIEGASLRGGKCRLPGNVSSQFLSALLMVAPTRAGGIEIEIEGDLVSKPYVEITLEVMRAFGIPDDAIEREGYTRFKIAETQYRAADYNCPPDGTAASYFWGAAAVARGRCVIDGLKREDVQGDTRFVEYLERMGCEVLEFPNGLGVDASGVEELSAIEADLAALPDCAQTLAVVCAFAKGTSQLTGLGTLRVKETDRIAALQTELEKLGVTTRAGDDWLEIDGGSKFASDALIHTYDDHRMAMSFAIAGLRVPIEIEDPDCISKSFPNFWEYWAKLG